MKPKVDRAALGRTVRAVMAVLFFLCAAALLVYIAVIVISASFLPLVLRVVVAALCGVMVFACIGLTVRYIT